MTFNLNSYGKWLFVVLVCSVLTAGNLSIAAAEIVSGVPQGPISLELQTQWIGLIDNFFARDAVASPDLRPMIQWLAANKDAKDLQIAASASVISKALNSQALSFAHRVFAPKLALEESPERARLARLRSELYPALERFAKEDIDELGQNYDRATSQLAAERAEAETNRALQSLSRASALYVEVEDQLTRQADDSATLSAMKSHAAVIQPYKDDHDAARFIQTSIDNLQDLETLSRKPSFVDYGVSLARAVRAGTGRMLRQAGSEDFFATDNLVVGVMSYLRLMDPKSQSMKATVDRFAQAFSAYKPDTGRVNTHGWGLFFAAVDVIKRAEKSGNEALKHVGHRILNDYRLVEDRMQGVTVDQNPTLRAELQVRFAQMALRFGLSVSELQSLNSRAEVLLRKRLKQEQIDQELVLGLVSLRLETHRPLARLTDDLARLLGSGEDELSSLELLWALRLSYLKNLSLADAKSRVLDLDQESNRIAVTARGDFEDRNRSSYTFYLSGRTSKALLLALLTYTDMMPEAIVNEAQAVLWTSVKSPTDYGASDRASAALARLFLEKAKYSKAARFVVTQAMAGYRTRD